MPRQFLLRTAFFTTSLLAGFAAADERKPDAIPVPGVPLTIQIVGEGAENEGAVKFQLGESSSYWLGVQLEEEDGALEVEEVVPDSPAAKAGLKEEDVLLSSGDTALKVVGDLQKLIQSSGGKPLSLKVRREGKEIVLEVKPERRSANRTIILNEEGEARGGDGEQVRKLRELRERLQAESQNAAAGRGGRAQRPGAAGNAPIPDDLVVTIKKKGNQPTRIKVRHAEHTWTVNEQELHKLPEPIREHVVRILSHGAPGRMMPGAAANPGANPAAMQAPFPGGIAGPRHAAPSEFEGLRIELHQLKDQLHALQEQVEALRKK